MDSVNWTISNVAYKSISCKHGSNMFPFCYNPLVDFIRVASVETNSVRPLVTVTDWIPFINYNSKY